MTVGVDEGIGYLGSSDIGYVRQKSWKPLVYVTVSTYFQRTTFHFYHFHYQYLSAFSCSLDPDSSRSSFGWKLLIRRFVFYYYFKNYLRQPVASFDINKPFNKFNVYEQIPLTFPNF